jgi:3-dehydroquinate dehydratase / shikimate dehydrogenase
MLCAVLTAGIVAELFRSDVAGADCVEVRLDYLQNPEEAAAVSWTRLRVPVIATCRRRQRGGLFDGTVEQERRILEQAVRGGAAYVDMDYRDAQPFAGAQVIGSFHDFEQTPANLLAHLQAACAGPAQIAKAAATVRSWADNRSLLELLDRTWAKPVIVTGMGEMGQITRLIGPSRGSLLTYAALPQHHGPSAPGQLTLSEMCEVYRYRRTRRSTRLFGVVGNPVSHSLGPLRHNAAFEKASVDCAYMKFLVSDVSDFFANAAAVGISGFSVTMPHKIAVMPFLSRVSSAARNVGAVNTVVWRDDGWFGDNTDVDGVRAALASVGFDPAGKRVVIMGNKGAARAAAVALKTAASVRMLSRAELPEASGQACDLLINATPVGMVPHSDESPLTGAVPADVVFDMVYNPPVTRLLDIARQAGKTVIPGTIMYAAQAARQFEIWTGEKAPAGVYT